MSGKFKPAVRAMLGGKERMIRFGYGEIADFRRIYGVPFMKALTDGLDPSAVMQLISIGLKPEKVSVRKVGEWFNEHGEEYTDFVTGPMTDLLEQLFPDSTEESEEVDASDPTPVKLTGST